MGTEGTAEEQEDEPLVTGAGTSLKGHSKPHESDESGGGRSGRIRTAENSMKTCDDEGKEKDDRR